MATDLLTHFSSIEDPRIDRFNKHELMDILFLAICAVLSNCESWEDIENFGYTKLEWLRKYLPFANGIPRHDTITRVISRLYTNTLQNSFMCWIQSVVKQVGYHRD